MNDKTAKTNQSILNEIREILTSCCEDDLLNLKSSSTVMQMQVITNGKRIYCADENAAEIFEDFVFSSYVFLNDE